MGSVKIKGVKELTLALGKKADLADVKTVVSLNGSALQTNAQRKAPVHTGALKRHIQLSIKDGGLTAEVTAGMHYSPYQEWGTRFMNAHPFMRPAFDVQKLIFKEDLKRLMK